MHRALGAKRANYPRFIASLPKMYFHSSSLVEKTLLAGFNATAHNSLRIPRDHVSSFVQLNLSNCRIGCITVTLKEG